MRSRSSGEIPSEYGRVRCARWPWRDTPAESRLNASFPDDLRSAMFAAPNVALKEESETGADAAAIT